MGHISKKVCCKGIETNSMHAGSLLGLGFWNLDRIHSQTIKAERDLFCVVPSPCYNLCHRKGSENLVPFSVLV